MQTSNYSFYFLSAQISGSDKNNSTETEKDRDNHLSVE